MPVERLVEAVESVSNRFLLGVGFIASAIANLCATAPRPQARLDTAVGHAFFGWYRDLVHTLVLPHAVLWVVALALYQLTAGALILTSGRRVRVGLWMVIAFLVGTAPLAGWYTALNLVLVVVPAALLYRRYELTVVGCARLAARSSGSLGTHC